MQKLLITVGGFVCLCSGLLVAEDLQDRITHIESRWKPAERMRALKVPGVSIAVIHNFRVEWTKTYGVAPGTLFQAASISKPVAAMAALNLVQTGNFSLDEDVNGKLTSWKLPDNEFTRGHKVTVRGILSHSGGLSVHGFRGYAEGEPLPTLIQILDGKKPANSAPIRVEFVPGSKSQYSGGGYTILQQLMMDRLRKPFPEIMDSLVLKKLAMRDSTYQQPVPAGLASRCATGYLANLEVVPGRWHTYPEMAAAGLWTTPADLALFAIELQKSLRGESNRILERETARQMVQAQFREFGLGLGIHGRVFEHSGSNVGFRCLLRASMDNGTGYVIMTNSENGMELIKEIAAALEAEYPLEPVPLR